MLNKNNNTLNLKNENLDVIVASKKPSIFTKKVIKPKKVLAAKPIKGVLGATRHFPSSTSEWTNSIYTYNSNSTKNLPVLDKNLSKIIKSYLNLSLKRRYIKSINKRLKTRFTRLSVRRIFVAKAELKHTNDKVLITLHVYDTQSKYLKKILFYYLKMSISAQAFFKDLLFPGYQEIDLSGKAFNYLSYLYENSIFLASSEEEEEDIPPYKSPYFHDYFTKVFKSTIQHLKGTFRAEDMIFTVPEESQEMQNKKVIALSSKETPEPELEKKEKKIKYDTFNVAKTTVEEYADKAEAFIRKSFAYKTSFLGKELFFFTLNKKLKNFMDLFKLRHLAAGDIRKKVRRAKRLMLKVSRQTRQSISMLVDIRNKFNIYINILTPLISKLYGKKVEFTIIKLKNMHLNSDILTQAMAVKLKNRDNKVLRVIKSALFLVKLPRINRIRDKYGKINKVLSRENRMKNLDFQYFKSSGLLRGNAEAWNIEKEIMSRQANVSKKMRNNLVQASPMITPSSKYLNNDILSTYLMKTLPSNQDASFLYNTTSPSFHEKERTIDSIGHSFASEKNVTDYALSQIKYKGVSGVRIIARGRLVRRSGKSRALSKLKWKGGLKNYETRFKRVPAVLLRGYAKDNVQFSLASGKTRNGAFGVRGWVGTRP